MPSRSHALRAALLAPLALAFVILAAASLSAQRVKVDPAEPFNNIKAIEALEQQTQTLKSQLDSLQATVTEAAKAAKGTAARTTPDVAGAAGRVKEAATWADPFNVAIAEVRSTLAAIRTEQAPLRAHYTGLKATDTLKLIDALAASLSAIDKHVSALAIAGDAAAAQAAVAAASEAGQKAVKAGYDLKQNTKV